VGILAGIARLASYSWYTRERWEMRAKFIREITS